MLGGSICRFVFSICRIYHLNTSGTVLLNLYLLFGKVEEIRIWMFLWKKGRRRDVGRGEVGKDCRF